MQSINVNKNYFYNTVDLLKNKKKITGGNAHNLKKFFDKAVKTSDPVASFNLSIDGAKKHFKHPGKAKHLFLNSTNNNNSTKKNNNGKQREDLKKIFEETIKKETSVPTTTKYDAPKIVVPKPQYESIAIEVENSDSFDAAYALRQQGFRPAVLNMANQYKTGGGVKNGASAQEESLCRRSNLYNGLISVTYPFKSTGTLISKNVKVVRDNKLNWLEKPFYVDVVSNAAKSLKELKKNNKIDSKKLEKYYKKNLPERIRGILNTAISNKNDSIVLGAHGCGAFGNDAQRVAEAFKKVLQEPTYQGCFKRVVFAVIDDKNGTGNFATFNKICNGVKI